MQDKNFALKTADALTPKWYDIKACPQFKIYGLYKPEAEPRFCRLPYNVAASVSEKLAPYAYSTSGGRIRFCTDSAYVAINAKMNIFNRTAHFSVLGTSGFDLYLEEGSDIRFYKSFIPPENLSNEGYSSVIEFGSSAMRTITIYFPLYNGVDSLEIGLNPGASLLTAPDISNRPPMLFYGSSITQGGCASRAGNSYSAILSRQFNTDFVNLGFSGAARGEQAMQNYLAGIKCSVFVCDYDHNALSVEALNDTHSSLFNTFRKQQPLTPVIFITRPDVWQNNSNTVWPAFYPTDDVAARREVIYKTYSDAKESGDENVYFIDGSELFCKEYRDCSTVDGLHPNDFGFVYMASRIAKVLKTIFS